MIESGYYISSIDNYPAPDGLSKRGQAIWRAIVPRKAQSAERLLLIKTALQALDRADQIMDAVNKEGLTIENPSSGAVRANPLLKIEKELRGQFAAIWSNLSLEWDAVVDGGNKTFADGEELEKLKTGWEVNDQAVKEFLKD